jgi:hypothetical protein
MRLGHIGILNDVEPETAWLIPYGAAGVLGHRLDKLLLVTLFYLDWGDDNVHMASLTWVLLGCGDNAPFGVPHADVPKRSPQGGDDDRGDSAHSMQYLLSRQRYFSTAPTAPEEKIFPVEDAVPRW